MKQRPLTKKQKAILDFLEEYHTDHGYAPSFREIGTQFGFTSTGTVAQYLGVLEAKGYIKSYPTQARAIEILEDHTRGRLSAIPLAGMIAAGAPIEAIEQKETIALPDNLLSSKECFALKVKGDSMIEDGILDGDFVIVERASDAKNGETVVALVGGDSATLKRFYREADGSVRLQPANSSMEPIYIHADEQIDIQGKVIGLVRRYK